MILFTFKKFEYIGDVLLAQPYVDKGEFEVRRFKNHEMSLRVATNVRDEHCLILGTIAPPDENLLSLLMLAHTLKKDGALKVTAVLPYLGYSRHDKEVLGESLGVALVGQELKAAGVDEVWTLDLHSEHDRELFPIKINPLSLTELFLGVLKSHRLQHAVLVAPDRGAVPRCEALSFYLTPPPHFAYFEKKRDERGIELLGPTGEIGKRAVLVDDILDTGETLVAAAKKLQQSGVEEIYVLVSHVLFTGAHWKELWGYGVKEIFCSDSVPYNLGSADRRVVRLPVAPLIAAHIREETGEVAIAADTGRVF